VNEDPDHLLVLWREHFDVLLKIVTFEHDSDVTAIGGSKELIRFAKLSKQRRRRD
jgi:hypothetical protein